jgi:heme/copper-type cytochrome/quinol oxidase subunit 2
MASKDQAIGWLIFIVCIVVIILYLVGLLYFGKPLGDSSATPPISAWTIQFTLVAIPVLLAFVLILGIGAWIGWTMATTPPPKPIEEIETEEKKESSEEAKEEGKKEGKKEE